MVNVGSKLRWAVSAMLRPHYLSEDGKEDCVWNVMAHAQKTDFVFRRKGRAHLNWRGRQFSRVQVAEVCASAVVMPDTPCSEVVWRVLATHSIRQFPLHFPFRASQCAIRFQLDSIYWTRSWVVFRDFFLFQGQFLFSETASFFYKTTHNFTPNFSSASLF
jgi:hypothetical protein